jgi:hypothetical protein
VILTTLYLAGAKNADNCSRYTHNFCHACQLDRHTCMPFVSFSSYVENNFDLIHCDIWTLPIVSISSYKYYLVILNECSHFVWTFLLRLKSNTFTTLLIFFAFVSTQFGYSIKVVQGDNGRSSKMPPPGHSLPPMVWFSTE